MNMPDRQPSRQIAILPPRDLHKAVVTLEGLLQGLSANGAVHSNELAVLHGWLEAHRTWRHCHPFCEVFPALQAALEDGRLEADELRDLLWLCRQISANNTLLPAAAADMAQLRGILTGILSDGRITAGELAGLREWLRPRSHLRRCWPYDEIETLVFAVLQDGQVDSHEQAELTRFFNAFAVEPAEESASAPVRRDEEGLVGVCSLSPEIEINGRTFSFAGQFSRYTKAEMIDLVVEGGGRHTDEVAADVDYLVVGSEGNPCWTYACYGRRVEQTIRLRRQGSKLLIVHEFDFCDSVEDGIEAQ